MIPKNHQIIIKKSNTNLTVLEELCKVWKEMVDFSSLVEDKLKILTMDDSLKSLVIEHFVH